MEFLTANHSFRLRLLAPAQRSLRGFFSKPLLAISLKPAPPAAADHGEAYPDSPGEVEHEPLLTNPRRRSKKQKIFCFNCNRQEFHIMAFKGTWLHSFLLGMSFGLIRFVGPYRCTCCGKKRAMYADFCSVSYHLRMWNQRRLSSTTRRRKRSSRR